MTELKRKIEVKTSVDDQLAQTRDESNFVTVDENLNEHFFGQIIFLDTPSLPQDPHRQSHFTVSRSHVPSVRREIMSGYSNAKTFNDFTRSEFSLRRNGWVFFLAGDQTIGGRFEQEPVTPHWISHVRGLNLLLTLGEWTIKIMVHGGTMKTWNSSEDDRRRTPYRMSQEETLLHFPWG